MNGTQEEINARVNNIRVLNIGDEVTVTIKSHDEMGYLVTLPDYNHTEGFISNSKKDYKVGSQYQAKVIRLDRDRGYLDLEFPKKRWSWH